MSGRFAGIQVKGIMVAASSPATESAEKVLKCQKGGAVAAILKTASKTRLADMGGRRCIIRNGQLYAKSTFNREILTIEQGIALIKDCKEIGVTIPIAASVTELALDPSDWVDDCLRMEAAGADVIQLDFFYIENLLCEPGFERRIVDLLSQILASVSIPIMPKLNISFPATYAAKLLKQSGIRYVSLLDSIKTPPPVSIEYSLVSHDRWVSKVCFESALSGGSLSVFGGFMFPITAKYTEILTQAGFEVCAGGGITDMRDAVNLLMLGASSVQLATEVLLNGYNRFDEIYSGVNEIGRFLAHGADDYSVECFYEHGRKTRDVAVAGKFAKISNKCGKNICDTECEKQTFCSHVRFNNGKPSFEGCEGCGLCVALCPDRIST